MKSEHRIRCATLLLLAALLAGPSPASPPSAGLLGNAAPRERQDPRPADDDLIAEAVNSHGRARELFEKRRYEQALEGFRETERLYERAGDGLRAANQLEWFARCKRGLGRRDEMLEPRLERVRRLRALPLEVVRGDLAWSLTFLANSFTDAGRNPEALVLRREALDLLREHYGEAHRHTANGLNNLASTLTVVGRPEEALQLWREALAIHERNVTDNHYWVLCLRGAGSCYASIGELQRAVDCFEKARAMAERLFTRDAGYGLMLCEIAVELVACLRSSERWLDAADTLEQLMATGSGTHVEDHLSESLTLALVADCLQENGLFDEALIKLEEVLAIERRRHGEEHPHVLCALLDVVMCLHRANHYRGNLRFSEEAIQRAREAVELSRELFPEGQLATTIALELLGTCLLDEEDEASNVQALAAYEEGLAVARSCLPEDHPLRALLLRRLATCLDWLGRPDEALERMHEQVEVLLRIYSDQHAEVALGLQALARAQDSAGRPAEALATAERALSIHRGQSSGDHRRVARCLQEMTSYLEALGRPEEADARKSEAEAMWMRLGEPAPVCGSAENTSPMTEAVFHSEIERLRSEGATLPEQARAVFFDQFKDSRVDAFIRRQARIGAFQSAVDAAERIRARSLLDLLQRSELDPVDEARQAATARGNSAMLTRLARVEERIRSTGLEIHHTELQLRTRPPALGVEEREQTYRELQAKLELLREAHERARRDLTCLIKDYLPLGEPVDASRLQSLLGPKECILMYHLGGSASFLFLVPPEGRRIRGWELTWSTGEPVSTADVDLAIREYRYRTFAGYVDNTALRGHGPTKKFEQLPFVRGRLRVSRAEVGNQLFRTLIPPQAWEEIQTRSLVYLVPHGPLHHLPFEALVVAEGASAAESSYWLDEGPPIAYEASGSTLDWALARAREAGERPSPGRLVAVGDPIFTAEAAGNALQWREADSALRREYVLRDREGLYGPLRSLPGSRKEVLAIDRLCSELRSEDPAPRVEILLGEDATEKLLGERAQHAQVLHLATHHLPFEPLEAYDAAGSSYSALALTPGPGSPRDDDGFLTLREVLDRWRGRLEGCELVFLSACSSNQGPSIRDEAIWALPTGFMYSGCPTIIASLWDIQDAGVHELVEGFYRRLLDPRNPMPALQAFTEARKDFRKSHPEPFLWAPFVLLGAPR